MSDWKNININMQNIETNTSRSVLIKMPNNSEYKGFKFWHPAKLVRHGRHSNAVSIGYTDEFTFRLFKTNKHYEIVEEEEIDVEEFEEAFGVTNENIRRKDFKSEYETHKPEALEAVEREALDELMEDE